MLLLEKQFCLTNYHFKPLVLGKKDQAKKSCQRVKRVHHKDSQFLGSANESQPAQH